MRCRPLKTGRRLWDRTRKIWGRAVSKKGGRGHSGKKQPNGDKNLHTTGQCNYNPDPSRPIQVTISVPPAERNEKAAREERNERRECIKLAVEIATLVAVVVYAGFAWWQARATSDAVILSRQTFESSSRAWVLNRQLRPTTIKGVESGTRTYRAVFENFGRTPARNVRLQMFLGIGKPNEPLADLLKRIEWQPDVVLSSSVEGPGQKFYKDAFLTKEQVEQFGTDLDNGTRFLVIAGIVQYEDDFSRDRETVFCHVKALPGPWTTGNFEWCPSPYNRVR